MRTRGKILRPCTCCGICAGLAQQFVIVFLFEPVLFIWVEQVSPEGTKRLLKLQGLKFEAYEYSGEVWWYHICEELWYWESEMVS